MSDSVKPAQTRANALLGFRRTIIGFLIVWVLCMLVWAFTGQGYFWPAWVALGMAVGAVYAWVRIRRIH